MGLMTMAWRGSAATRCAPSHASTSSRESKAAQPAQTGPSRPGLALAGQPPPPPPTPPPPQHPPETNARRPSLTAPLLSFPQGSCSAPSGCSAAVTFARVKGVAASTSGWQRARKLGLSLPTITLNT